MAIKANDFIGHIELARAYIKLHMKRAVQLYRDMPGYFKGVVHLAQYLAYHG